MTRNEIIYKIMKLRKQGYTYKGIALAAGIENPDKLYKFMARDYPAAAIQQKLETYLRKLEEQDE